VFRVEPFRIQEYWHAASKSIDEIKVDHTTGADVTPKD
jgi:hypothetical protein